MDRHKRRLLWELVLLWFVLALICAFYEQYGTKGTR